MNSVSKCLLVAFILITSSAAAADRGFYFGGSLGLSSVDGTADTDSTVSVIGGLPTELPINGLPFDDNDGAWSAFVGFQAFQFVGFELAYSDLGRFDSAVSLSPIGEPLSLDIEEWSISARFRYPLGKKFYANWYAGVSRATFDVEGEVQLLGFFGPGPLPPFGILPPPVIGIGQAIPFASPDDETGFIWGFGFTWQFLEKFGVGLDYRQHKVQVQDVDTMNLTLIYSL